MSAGDRVVEVRDLTVRFGDHVAVNDIDLDVDRGAIVGLIGPSGCGKSTLVRTMLGIAAPTSGHVRVFGKDPMLMGANDRGRVAYMPQMPVLFPHLSVMSNLRFVASLYGVPMRGRRRRLRDVLDLVDLGAHANKQLADCSGGMQRRLTLAATLVHDPELLFLDEPTAGIDPILRERFWAHFRELRGRGKTIVVPTQYVGEAVSCDLVAIMAAGRIVSVSTPEELASHAFKGDPLRVQLATPWISTRHIDAIAALDFVTAVRRMDDDLLVVVEHDFRDRPRLVQHLEGVGLPPVSVEPTEPTFDQIFVELIENHRAETGESEAEGDGG